MRSRSIGLYRTNRRVLAQLTPLSSEGRCECVDEEAIVDLIISRRVHGGSEVRRDERLQIEGFRTRQPLDRQAQLLHELIAAAKCLRGISVVRQDQRTVGAEIDGRAAIALDLLDETRPSACALSIETVE